MLEDVEKILLGQWKKDRGTLKSEEIPCDGLFYEPVCKSARFPLKAVEYLALATPASKKGTTMTPACEYAGMLSSAC
jgi:hypothetical protein